LLWYRWALGGAYFEFGREGRRTLGPLAVCHVFVQFQPITQGGIIGGSLAVSGSQPGSPQLLNLSGAGN